MICIVQAARQLPWSPQMSPQKMQFSLAARSPLCQASWPHPTGIAGAIQVPRPVSLPSRLSSGVTSGTRGCRGVCVHIPPIVDPMPSPALG